MSQAHLRVTRASGEECESAGEELARLQATKFHTKSSIGSVLETQFSLFHLLCCEKAVAMTNLTGKLKRENLRSDVKFEKRNYQIVTTVEPPISDHRGGCLGQLRPCWIKIFTH